MKNYIARKQQVMSMIAGNMTRLRIPVVGKVERIDHITLSNGPTWALPEAPYNVGDIVAVLEPHVMDCSGSVCSARFKWGSGEVDRHHQYWRDAQALKPGMARLAMHITTLHGQQMGEISNSPNCETMHKEGIYFPGPIQSSNDSDIEWPDVDPMEIYVEDWNDRYKHYVYAPDQWTWVMDFNLLEL